MPFELFAVRQTCGDPAEFLRLRRTGCRRTSRHRSREGRLGYFDCRSNHHQSWRRWRWRFCRADFDVSDRFGEEDLESCDDDSTTSSTSTATPETRWRAHDQETAYSSEKKADSCPVWNIDSLNLLNFHFYFIFYARYEVRNAKKDHVVSSSNDVMPWRQTPCNP